MRSILVAASVMLSMLLGAALLGPRDSAPPLPTELVGADPWLVHAEQISLLRLPLFVASLALTPAALWFYVRGGRSARLRRRLAERGARNPWLLAGVFTIIITAGLALLELPLAYAGYLVRRVYGLTPEPQLAWLLRYWTELGIAVVPLLIAIEGLYWLLRAFPRFWWLLASVGYILFSLALTYLHPLVITPLLFTQRPLEDTTLRARIVQMGSRVGIPLDEVFVIDASKQGNEGNAYLTGIGGSTRIVLYDTLLASYPPDELLAILAHELGHWRERHIWKGLVLSWMLAPVSLLAAHWLLQALLPRWGVRSPADIAGLPFLLLLLNLATLATLPIQNWQSRRWEAAADQIALAATGDRQAAARTFVRLARQNLSDPTPHPLVEGLFLTHPAIGRRVARAWEDPARP